MKLFKETRLFLSFIIVMLLCVLTAGITGIGVTASADATASGDNVEGSIKIAHITDVHYFSYSHCFNENLSSVKLEDTEYYSAIAGDTKLMRESGTVLSATIKGLLAEKADVLVVSGDVTSNGEIYGHYDVSNALRYLQNAMRAAGKPNFQVFVVPGNHDLYNYSASIYDPITGKMTRNDSSFQTISAQFALIYNGLGYPSKTAEELSATSDGQAILKYYNDDYDATTSYTKGYEYSSLSSAFTYSYYADVKGYPTADDRAQGCLSYVATMASTGYCFLMVDSTEREARDKTPEGTELYWKWLTGGRICKDLQNWLLSETADERSSEYTLFATMHHNITPHYTLEENYTKDFTLYNWEDSATFLADEVGVRYAFTGHMHANDRAQFTSYKGNVIQDFETGSLVSLFSPTRFFTITRSYSEATLTEDVNTITVKIESLEGIKSLSINDAASDTDENMYLFNDINDLEYSIGEQIYDVMAERLLDSFVSNSLADTAKNAIRDLNLSSNFLTSMWEPFLTEFLCEVIDQAFFDMNYNLGGYTANSLTDLIKQIALSENVFNIPVYTSPSGKVYTFVHVGVWCYKCHIMGNEPAVFDVSTENGAAAAATMEMLRNGSLVETLLHGILDPLLLNDDSLIKQLYTFEFNIEDVIESNKASAKTFFNIFFAADNELNPLNSGKLSIKVLLNAAVNSKAFSSILDKLASGTDIIGTIVEVIKNDPIAYAEDLLDKYMTKSFFTSIGGIAVEALTSFGTDASPDGITVAQNLDGYAESDWTHVLPDTTATYGATVTYNGAPLTVAQNKPTLSDGRVPSILTSTFGDDSATSQNFVWYTNYRVGAEFKYRKSGDTEWIKVTEDSDMYSCEYKIIALPLIDVGLFATYTATETDDGTPYTFDLWKNRDNLSLSDSVKLCKVHNLKLTGLNADTEYEYLVYGTYDFNCDGSVADNSSEKYCAQSFVDGWDGTPYSFKTALKKGSDEAFTFLAITDIQGTINSSYVEALTALKAAGNKYNYDFIVNCGDVTDSGKNIKLWSYAQNTLSTIFGNTTTVVAAGNHEDSDYGLSSYYNFGNLGNADTQNTETGVYYSFNYGNTHFVVLNTNDVTSTGLAEAQLNWLTADLAATNTDADIDYTVVMLHKSLYSVGSHTEDSDVVALRSQLTPLFYDNGVDIVLQGHDHTYSTTQLLDRNGNAVGSAESTERGIKYSNNSDGVLYITLGTIADKYYEYRQNEELEKMYDAEQTIFKQLDAPLFSSITVSADGISIDTCAYADLDGNGAKVVTLSEYRASLENSSDVPNKNKLLWLWITLGALATIGIAISIYFVVKKKNGLA